MVEWIVQDNLGKSTDNYKIELCCQKYGYGFRPVFVIPFSDDIVETSPNSIVYGSTYTVNKVYESNGHGVFFDRDKFTYDNYLRHYKDYMLNSEAERFTLGKFAEVCKEDVLYFVRPNKDLKEFAGEVLSGKDIKDWQNKLAMNKIDFDTDIIVSEPYKINHEWRCFIVEGKFITGSHYREEHELKVSSDVPDNVIKFVEGMTNEWSPHDIFAMDVAKCGGRLYVVECGCVNSCGFYASNIEKFVTSISDYVERKLI